MNQYETAPWTVALTDGQYMLVYYALVVAALALLASFLHSLTSREEVGPRYRPAVIASIAIKGVAFVSYVALILNFDLGYDRTGGGYVPNESAIGSFAPRYMDWTVTVPLLCACLLVVTGIAGGAARRTRFIAMTAAFFMILFGYLGGVVIEGGESVTALITFGLISTVFFVVVYVVLIRAVRHHLGELSNEAGRSLVNALLLLLTVWLIYPLAYLVQIVSSGGEWTTAIQIAYSAADIAAKVGFGALIHKVAKVRTADDIRHGIDVHRESTWISSIKKADAALPPVHATVSQSTPSAARRRGRWS
jgi:bacteriorhodopsin